MELQWDTMRKATSNAEGTNSHLPYLDVDRLVVDGNLPPFYLQTSTEDYLADNTLDRKNPAIPPS